MAKSKVPYHNPLMIVRSRKYNFTGCVGVSRQGFCKFLDELYSFDAGLLIIHDAFSLGLFRPRDILLRFTMDPEVVALIKICMDIDCPFMKINDVLNFLSHIAYFNCDFSLDKSMLIFDDLKRRNPDFFNRIVNLLKHQ